MNFVVSYKKKINFETENFLQMLQLAYQEFIFKQDLAPYEADLLRSAVLKLIGPSDVLYHNHLENGFYYNYPHIQYKSILGKAAILYLDKAVSSIGRLSSFFNTTVEINGKNISFEIEKIRAHLFDLKVHSALSYYDIINWLPLQDDYYRQYQGMQTDEERTALLQKKMIQNIITFAKSVGWYIEEEVIVTDIKIYKKKWISFKGEKFIGLNLRFATNVFLPSHIGLGKGAAHNYGVIYPVKIHSKAVKQNE